MAPKKFTYTPGTGGGARTKAFAKKGAASKAASAKDKAALEAWAKSQQARGAFGPVTGTRAPGSKPAQFNLNAAGMGSKSPLNKQVKRTTKTINEFSGAEPLKRIAQGRGSKMDVAMTAATVLPVGKAAGLIVKGGKALLKPAPAYAATKATLPKAAKATAENPWAGKPRQIPAMVNKQRRADLAKIAEKTGEPRTKIGAEQVKVTPKQGPKKSPPTVPPTKGVAIKTDDTPKIGGRPRSPRVIPEEYRATRPTDVAGETIKPFDAPRPQYQQFKVDGKYGEAEKAKFKAAVKEWKRKSNAAEKKATNAPAEQRTGTPLEKMREDVARARFREAKGNFYKAGKQEGSTEARIQNTALKEEAAVDRARGAEYAQMLKETPGGVAPERPPVRYPNEGTRGGKTYDSRKSKFTTRPAKVRVAPKRADFATDAKYQSAKNKYDKAIADARAKADVKQQSVKPGTDTPTDRPGNVAPSIAPQAPFRKGGFKETGFRFRFEGKTGKAGEPEMTKRPKLTEEAYVGEESIKARKQFQGIRPGKEVPEYRNVIDNLPDAKPAPKAKAPSAKAPAAKSKGKAKTETKAKEEAPEVTPESATARPAAMKSPTKAGASKTKFRPGMKAPSKSASPTPAASTPKRPSAKKEKVEDAKPAETPKAETPEAPTPKPPRARKPKPATPATPAATPKAPAAKRPEKAGARPRRPSAKQMEQARASRAEYDAALKSGDPVRIRSAKARLIKGAAITGGVGATGLSLKLTRDSDVSPNEAKPKPAGQAAMDDARTRRLNARREQFERASAKPKPNKKFGAAGESKFLKGRSAVRQSVIDQINKQGMTKALAAVKSRRNDPEYLEAIRRYYGAKRLKQALEG